MIEKKYKEKKKHYTVSLKKEWKEKKQKIAEKYFDGNFSQFVEYAINKIKVKDIKSK